MYKVKNKFKENYHDGHIYNPGEVYPAKDYKLVKSRAEELAMTHPKYGVTFLEAVEEKLPNSTSEKGKNTVRKGKETLEKSDV
ncbi:hypothetical protein AWH56_005230 [Anaerobacillus isosaccharinicus]|uniref:Uncharacterized protein n=1 Tax=Anaerobacillus isosaccharinicus TaxID=1532552 RepID=A0A1S2L9I6_9BACI|nr:hypothetical protein [Anaerobacillus isosaccharinicus]MBA5584571.1 hypothetical protein [Anaerobacillus isosaccharinicus]QOY37048.1 hypothetical protein AWH56_005230 [Anaerobacillus isosaccharinicus]